MCDFGLSEKNNVECLKMIIYLNKQPTATHKQKQRMNQLNPQTLPDHIHPDFSQVQ